MRHLVTLARHIGKKNGIKVEFKAGGASTNGKTIYLPESVTRDENEPVLAALLHEATHIRETNMDVWEQIAKHGTTMQRDCVNCLEDIRIDLKVFDRFGGAVDLYRKSKGYTRTMLSAEDLKKIPPAFKFLCNVTVRAEGMPDLIMKDDEAVNKIEKKTRVEVDGIIGETKKAKGITTVKAIGYKLADLVCREFYANQKPDKKKTEDVRQERDAKDNELEKGEEKENDLRIQRREKEKQQEGKKFEKYDLNDEIREDSDKAETKGKDGEDVFSPEAKEKIEEDLKEKKEKVAALQKQIDETQEDLEDLDDEITDAMEENNKLTEERDSLNNELKHANGNADYESDADAKVRSGAEVGKGTAAALLDNGFKALNDVLAPATAAPIELASEIEQGLIDLLSNSTIISKKSDSGRLNSKKLHKFYKVDELFQHSADDDRQNTELVVVIDHSWSMKGTKIERANAVFNTLSNAVYKGVAEGLIDESMFRWGAISFNHTAAWMKELNDDNRKCESQLYANNGTDINPVINLLKTKPLEGNAKRIVMILTDGEISYTPSVGGTHHRESWREEIEGTVIVLGFGYYDKDYEYEVKNLTEVETVLEKIIADHVGVK